jgi:predicted RNA binding protein YcfA (HicA-like mRNA interferase family)
MKLPVCSGRGSHVTLFKPHHPVVLTVPLHRELGRGLLRDLIRKAGLTVDEFTQLLK